MSKDKEDVIIIPSLSLDQSELSKIPAVTFYEERQLCTLFFLNNPNLRLVYVTSMPVDKAIVEYYLGILEQTSMVSANEAHKRLFLVSCNDSSVMPLTSKILRRPKLVQKIRNFINPAKAHMTCFISSNLERDLACQLEVPLFSNDPSLSYWGTKIGSREAFKQAGIKFAKGTPLFYTVGELVSAIAKLYIQEKCSVRKFVIKLNVGFSGEGNALLRTDNFNKNQLEDSILKCLGTELEYTYTLETWATFQEKIQEHGVLAEVWVENAVESPSCQALINPRGEVELLSTHEQLLNGGMVYQGCVFPASENYRKLIMDATYKVGQVLSSKGCRERFAVDYVVLQEEGEWVAYAIEINLRWGGTSHPMITAKNLTNSELTEEGLLRACDDEYKFYVATDNVQNDVYTGLTPEDFLEFVHSKPELQFDGENLTGVVFHLLSAISVHGKFGFIAIENSPEKALELYERTVELLEKEATEISQNKQYTELDLKITMPESG